MSCRLSGLTVTVCESEMKVSDDVRYRVARDRVGWVEKNVSVCATIRRIAPYATSFKFVIFIEYVPQFCPY